MGIEPPPAIQYHLLEQPLFVVITLIVVAAILMGIARRTASRRLVISAGVCVGVAVGVLLLARVVDTDRERLIAHTRELVQATAPMQLRRFAGLLDERMMLVGPEERPWLNRDQILSAMQNITSTYAIEEQRVDVLGAQITGPQRGISLVDVTTYPSPHAAVSYAPVRTRWLLQWSRRREGQDEPAWRITQVQWLNHPAPNGLAPQRNLWIR